MRKGQILSQVFILILAGAVFIMILLYGYSAINVFTERSRQICMIDFSSKLQTAVKTIAIDAGSTDTLSLDPCEGFAEICIVDADNLPAFAARMAGKHLLIQNLAESKTQNVFFFPPADFSFFVPNMQVRKGGFCKTLSGRLSLRLEGLGNKALVSESGFEEAEENVIEITEAGFSELSKVIRKGETVKFINHHDQVHIIMLTGRPATTLQPDDVFEATFTKPGTFFFNDQSNQAVKGTIKVS